LARARRRKVPRENICPPKHRASLALNNVRQGDIARAVERPPASSTLSGGRSGLHPPCNGRVVAQCATRAHRSCAILAGRTLNEPNVERKDELQAPLAPMQRPPRLDDRGLLIYSLLSRRQSAGRCAANGDRSGCAARHIASSPHKECSNRTKPIPRKRVGQRGLPAEE
jgi:hypothetical protein